MLKNIVFIINSFNSKVSTTILLAGMFVGINCRTLFAFEVFPGDARFSRVFGMVL